MLVIITALVTETVASSISPSHLLLWPDKPDNPWLELSVKLRVNKFGGIISNPVSLAKGMGCNVYKLAFLSFPVFIITSAETRAPYTVT